MKKVIIDNVEKDFSSLSAIELKQLFIDNGFSESKLSDATTSFLPDGKEVTFTDFEFTSYKPDEAKEESYAGINLIATDGKNNFNCTLSRLQMFGTIAKETDNEEDIKALVKQSKKGVSYVTGSAINEFLPNGKHLAVQTLLNKKFKVEKVEVYQCVYEKSDVVAKTSYKLTLA
jgi:hypothetical protein